ncbi:Hypothetical predicted protein [Lecanosticta acicola]|uniref:Uncharacterized protein n=1 Tax=Lecanosticta acicola TaxID=111012 RepID=A0AAI9E8H2_9PEZI|nr:Hypothetical predicted protein [Lecanosticta acicola]
MLSRAPLRVAVLRKVATFKPARGTATSKDTRPSDTPSQDDQKLEKKALEAEAANKPEMTQAQKDKELMEKLAGISGEGGEAGIEYEDGKPVAMKRGVKNNMFRLI